MYEIWVVINNSHILYLFVLLILSSVNLYELATIWVILHWLFTNIIYETFFFTYLMQILGDEDKIDGTETELGDAQEHLDN